MGAVSHRPHFLESSWSRWRHDVVRKRGDLSLTQVQRKTEGLKHGVFLYSLSGSCRHYIANGIVRWAIKRLPDNRVRPDRKMELLMSVMIDIDGEPLRLKKLALAIKFLYRNRDKNLETPDID